MAEAPIPFKSLSRRIKARDAVKRPPDVALRLHHWGFAVRGEATAVAENGVVVCRVAWVQAQ